MAARTPCPDPGTVALADGEGAKGLVCASHAAHPSAAELKVALRPVPDGSTAPDAEEERLEATLRDLAEVESVLAALASHPDRVRRLLSGLRRQDREALAVILAELGYGPRRGTP